MFGNFGSTLAEAKRSEFFVFFHLEESTKSNQGELTSRTYRPSSDQFQNLVSIQMVTDSKERLQSVALVIQRAFIDHNEISTFAADITKSFLVAAVNEPDIEMVGEAALQIRRYHPAGSRMVVMSVKGRGATGPLAPGEGEPEYLTYAGKRRQQQRALKTVTLHMANGLVDGVEQLTIAITPK
jgi:hypothetical protein